MFFFAGHAHALPRARAFLAARRRAAARTRARAQHAAPYYRPRPSLPITFPRRPFHAPLHILDGGTLCYHSSQDADPPPNAGFGRARPQQAAQQRRAQGPGEAPNRGAHRPPRGQRARAQGRAWICHQGGEVLGCRATAQWARAQGCCTVRGASGRGVGEAAVAASIFALSGCRPAPGAVLGVVDPPKWKHAKDSPIYHASSGIRAPCRARACPARAPCAPSERPTP